jgi:hypothetical protein
MVAGSHDIHRGGNSDLTLHVFAMGILLDLYICNRQPFMSASDCETVSYAMRRVSKALSDD